MNVVNDPYGFIYITTNLVNGKRYIGQKIFDTNHKWKSYIGSGRHFLRAVKKYGKENFVRNIVDIAHSPEELNKKEITWIEIYDAVENDDFYNIIEGGNTGNHLKRKNSIPVICIDNNLVFKSIADASIWSGYTIQYIRSSFRKKHKFNNLEELIFRPLCRVRKGKHLCCVCGANFKPKSNAHKMCKKCSDKKGKEKLLVDFDFHINNSVIEIYKLTDDWVKNEVEYNTLNKVKYENYINKIQKKTQRSSKSHKTL